MLNPQHLLTFCVVAKFCSITRAAQSLNIGQPAVSGQLKLLQGAVGEPLYEREGHRIVLTPAGESLLEYASNFDKSFNEANEFVRCLQEINAGTLRIGSTMTIASFYLPKYVVQLQTLHHGVQVFMKTGNTHEILKNLSSLDLGFIEGPIDRELLPKNYQLIPWQEDEIVLVLPEGHELAHMYSESVPLHALLNYPVIWREPESGARQVLERALAKAKLEIPVNIEVMGVSGIKEAVRAGLGIGFSSSQALRYEREGLVARRLNSTNGLLWHLNIIAPKVAIQSRAVKAFLELCDQKESGLK
ncbi:MAG: LysR family transcriptional regulator [Methylococcales bacterium]|jgi:DNA-binding transcriptional LysR family regulator|nr:LysR family transcriptional regulator [Methylococcales bacterium]